MTTLQRLTIFGVSAHGFERLHERAMERTDSNECHLLGVAFEKTDYGLGFNDQTWFFSGLTSVDVDRPTFESRLRDVINDRCWVLTEAEQSFDWSLPGIESVRPDLASLLLRDQASVLEHISVGRQFRACYLGSPF
jgi:hypothetical protein